MTSPGPVNGALVRAFRDAADACDSGQHYIGADSHPCCDAAGIAAVRPLIEAQERARIADAIEAHEAKEWPPDSNPDRLEGYRVGLWRAARIARGDT